MAIENNGGRTDTTGRIGHPGIETGGSGQCGGYRD